MFPHYPDDQSWNQNDRYYQVGYSNVVAKLINLSRRKKDKETWDQQFKIAFEE